jgi:muconolactone delta-isomerase
LGQAAFSPVKKLPFPIVPAIVGLSVPVKPNNGGERMSRGFGCLSVLAILISIIGCDQVQDTPKAPMPAPAMAVVPATIDRDLVKLSDPKIERSKAFRIDGDLRPIWIVSGRIRNLSDIDIKSVSISVRVESRPPHFDLLDESILKIDVDIPAHSIASFSRDVQLLPPSIPWQWAWSVEKAVPK